MQDMFVRIHQSRSDGLGWVSLWTPQERPVSGVGVRVGLGVGVGVGGVWVFRVCKSCVFVYLTSTVGMLIQQ